MHTAIILLTAAVIGLLVGTLTFLAGHGAATAILAGLAASGTSILPLRSLIGQ